MRATVVITGHESARADDLLGCLDAVVHQTAPPEEAIICIDQNPSLLRAIRTRVPRDIVVIGSAGEGLSASRNTALSRARGEMIAFLDDDGLPDANWLGFLSSAFENPDVFAAGGPVLPIWYTAPPAWLAPDFYWVLGCTGRGQYSSRETIRNLFSTNLAFRTRILKAVGGFSAKFGLRKARERTAEEAEVCLRIRAMFPEMRLVFDPRAKVSHRVYPYRLSLEYALRRSFVEGRSKALVYRSRARRSHENILGPERAFSAQLLRAVSGFLRLTSPEPPRLSPAEFAGMSALSLMALSGFVRGFLEVQTDHDASSVANQIRS